MPSRPSLSFDSLYGSTFECECGKTHRIDPKRVVYSPDAVSLLPEAIAPYVSARRAAVIVDARTREAAGDAVTAALRDAGWEARQILVPDAHGASPVCDEATRDWVLAELGDFEGIVLPVGSGVLNDLGKWSAAERELPYACFGTAASMNGYAAANVAVTVNGVKSLAWARSPRVILTDPSVLLNAPYVLTTAGLGDILAKSVSSADWWMNHVVSGDYFCARSVALIEDIEPLYRDHSEDLVSRKTDAFEALFQGLLLTGVAMTMAETSSPASGGEHLISHSLDMMSSIDGVPHDLHGRQVGVATVVASALYERVLAIDSPEFRTTGFGVHRDFWGPLAGSVEAAFQGKMERVQQARDFFRQGSNWDTFRESVRGFLRSPASIRECLRKGEAAWSAEHLGITRDRFLQALVHGHEMRARFTCLDLARMVGVLPDQAEDLVREWA